MIPSIAFIMTLWDSVASAARSVSKAVAAFIVTLQPPGVTLSAKHLSHRGKQHE
jgi:hypothetical protein